MLTLSTVVLIQVYINYIKKLLKVGSILVTIFVIASIGSQSRANLSLSLQCRCCYRDNCGRSDSSDLSAYTSFASAQTKSAFVLVFPAPPIASLLRGHVCARLYNVDNAVAVAVATAVTVSVVSTFASAGAVASAVAATALIAVDVAIFAAGDVSSARAYAVAESSAVAVAAAATLDVLFYFYLC